MAYLELKIPPLLLFLICAVIILILASVFPSLQVPFTFKLYISCFLTTVGGMIVFFGLAGFRKAETTVNPVTLGAASSLVTTGIYSFSRNPMYLGFLLLLLSMTVYLSNIIAYSVPPFFCLYLHRFQIKPEEKVLSASFGSAYTDYQNKVRAWI
jgi:protein-S-isoprenylcysteine O-methyltransferase Ste14